jgi:hypothetical protein
MAQMADLSLSPRELNRTTLADGETLEVSWSAT